MLIAVQLLVGLRRPWLPRFIARRGPKRQTLARFERIVDTSPAIVDGVVYVGAVGAETHHLWAITGDIA